MMFLSVLFINVGDNPDRPRPGRLWLRNVYRVHQRLCMAFPSMDPDKESHTKKERDEHFLKPYAPADFPEDRFLADKDAKKDPPEVNREALKQVHTKRNDKSGFLFRIDPRPGDHPAIVVLSALEPDWEYAFQNARHLLAAPPSFPRPLEVDIREGGRFRFRLVANTAFKVRAKSVGGDGKPLDGKWIGRRVPVPGDDDSLRNWLVRRAGPAGFRIPHDGQVSGGSSLGITTGFYYVNKDKGTDGGHRFRYTRYEGLLEVTDADAFRQALAAGMGPAKAFGCGLLSVVPVRD